MAGRFRRGLSIVDDSVDVFRDNPSLAILPLLSLLSVGSAFAAVAGVLLYYGVLGDVLGSDFLQYVGVFVGLAVSSSVGVFFNAAVVHCAAKYFDGEETSAREGLAAAWRVRRRIALWSVAAATLGTVLYIIDDKLGPLGSLARLLFDLAWSLLTFFVVPVIVLEDTDALRPMLRQSGAAFRDTWGESVSASLGVSFVFLPVALVGLVCLGWAYFAAAGLVAYTLGTVGFVLLVASMVISQVVGMIARTALYRYATTGEQVGPFTGRKPDSVFPSK